MINVDNDLLNAVWNDNLDRVKSVLALDNGIDINIKDNNENTALIIASYKENIEIVKSLLDHGAGVNIKNNKGYTALILASYKGNIGIVDLLKSHGAIE